MNAIVERALRLVHWKEAQRKRLNDRSLLRGGMWCPTQCTPDGYRCAVINSRSEWGTRHTVRPAAYIGYYYQSELYVNASDYGLGSIASRRYAEAVCVASYRCVRPYPGESAWDKIGNVRPHPAMKRKTRLGALKILGRLTDDGIQPADIISARCVRVLVLMVTLLPSKEVDECADSGCDHPVVVGVDGG